jgi:hypothetical protein
MSLCLLPQRQVLTVSQVPEDLQSILNDNSLFSGSAELTTKEILKRYADMQPATWRPANANMNSSNQAGFSSSQGSGGPASSTPNMTTQNPHLNPSAGVNAYANTPTIMHTSPSGFSSPAEKIPQQNATSIGQPGANPAIVNSNPTRGAVEANVRPGLSDGNGIGSYYAQSMSKDVGLGVNGANIRREPSPARFSVD